jgi:predicted phosphodiesterase
MLLNSGMKQGIISDIHGYVEPLEIVLKALKNEADEIICLGDYTSGGREERESTEILMAMEIRGVRGNHEAMAVSRNYGLDEKIKNYISRLQRTIESDGMIFCHSNPLREALYGIPPWNNDSAIKTEKLARIVFEKDSHRLIFVGHSHIPVVFEYKNGKVIEHPLAGGGQVKLDKNSRYILNPGAVADPKVLTPHSVAHPKKNFDAHYAIYDSDARLFIVKSIPVFRDGKPVIEITETHKKSYI